MFIDSEKLLQCRILIVDDDAGTTRVLERVFRRAGYSGLRVVNDARQAVSAFNEFAPDLILLDLRMPGMDGHQILEALGPHMQAAGYPPVAIMTGDETDAAKRQCFSAGARDFLSKPFDDTEVVLRARNLLESRLLFVNARNQAQELEERVRERTQELEQAQFEILDRLARAAEFRDDDTGEHTQRVGGMAMQLAVKLGMSAEECELLRRAAPLHDVGKIGIPDTILLKPGKLTAEEFDRIKTHAEIGARLLSGSRFPVLQMAEAIALSHHENWNGTGYPRRVQGEQIPLPARITAVVDVFDALTHDRPYKKAWPVEQAMAEILSLSGTKFDPAVVAAFCGTDTPN